MQSKTKNVQSKIAFGQLIVRKIIKTVATKCHFKAKMLQNSAGALPQTLLGELTALPQTPWLDLRGPTSNGRGREGSVVASKISLK